VLVEAAELVEKGKLIKKTIDLLTVAGHVARDDRAARPWISDVRSCDIEDMKKALVNALGPDVNLANVPPASIIDTEATRTGLGTAGPPK
jgi:phosphosulfolactate synthase